VTSLQTLCAIEPGFQLKRGASAVWPTKDMRLVKIMVTSSVTEER
jgi:hypothetical protein